MIVVGGKKLLPLSLGAIPYVVMFLIVVSLVLHICGASIALIVGSVCIIVAGIVLLDAYYVGKYWHKENSQNLSDDRRFEIFTGVAIADPQNPKEVHIEELRRSLINDLTRENRREECRISRMIQEERSKRIFH